MYSTTYEVTLCTQLWGVSTKVELQLKERRLPYVGGATKEATRHYITHIADIYHSQVYMYVRIHGDALDSYICMNCSIVPCAIARVKHSVSLYAQHSIAARVAGPPEGLPRQPPLRQAGALRLLHQRGIYSPRPGAYLSTTCTVSHSNMWAIHVSSTCPPCVSFRVAPSANILIHGLTMFVLPLPWF